MENISLNATFQHKDIWAHGCQLYQHHCEHGEDPALQCTKKDLEESIIEFRKLVFEWRTIHSTDWHTLQHDNGTLSGKAMLKRLRKKRDEYLARIDLPADKETLLSQDDTISGLKKALATLVGKHPF